jgi:hypothetical protein
MLAVSSLKRDSAFQVDDFTGKNLSGSFKAEAFAWPVVELSRNGVEVALGDR